MIQRILELLVRRELEVDVMVKHIQSLTCFVQNLNFVVHIG